MVMRPTPRPSRKIHCCRNQGAQLVARILGIQLRLRRGAQQGRQGCLPCRWLTNNPNNPKRKHQESNTGKSWIFVIFFWGGSSFNEIQSCLNITHRKLWTLFATVFYWWKKIHPFCLNLRNHPPVSDLWASNIKSKHTKKTIAGW